MAEVEKSIFDNLAKVNLIENAQIFDSNDISYFHQPQAFSSIALQLILSKMVFEGCLLLSLGTIHLMNYHNMAI